MNLRLAGTALSREVNGPGLRFVVWVQGCSIHCPGCFSRHTWDSHAGQEADTAALVSEIMAARGIRGVTVSGGEPLDQPEAVADLLARLPGYLDVVLFSGYTEAQIEEDSRKRMALARVDLLVAGPFVADLRGPYVWRGSGNQTLVELTGRIRTSEAMPEAAGGVEVQIRPDGSALVTGFPPFPLSPPLTLSPSPLRGEGWGEGRGRG